VCARARGRVQARTTRCNVNNNNTAHVLDKQDMHPYSCPCTSPTIVTGHTTGCTFDSFMKISRACANERACTQTQMRVAVRYSSVSWMRYSNILHTHQRKPTREKAPEASADLLRKLTSRDWSVDAHVLFNATHSNAVAVLPCNRASNRSKGSS